MSESEQGYSSEDYEEAQYEQKSYLSQSNNSGQRYDAGQDNEEDHEIKAIINNVLHKHYKRSLEASRNNNGERIRKINDELEGQNNQYIRKIRRLQTKLSKIANKKVLDEKVKEKSMQLSNLRKRLDKAQTVNSKMESEFSELAESRKKSKIKRQKKQTSRESCINYFSPILNFRNYEITQKGSGNSVGTQATLDQEQILREEEELEERKLKLQIIIEENNRKINEYEKKSFKYM